MGILDPAGFAGGEMRLDPELARRAFEALDTPLSLEQRVSFAYRLAVANIAEEVTNVAVRHGVDPRDFTLVAYGAAGPMLLPAALDLLQVARIVIPPHPGLFSAMGLLSTDLVYYESRSAYVVLSPDSAAQVEDGYQQMERALRERVGAAADGVAVAPQPRRAPARPELGDAVRRGRRRADHRRDDARAGRALPRGLRAPLRQPLPLRAGPGRHLSRAARRPRRQDRVRRRASGHRARARASAHRSSCATSPTSRCRRASYEREELPIDAVVHGPAMIREALSTTFVMPGQVAEVGRFGEISIEQRA